MGKPPVIEEITRGASSFLPNSLTEVSMSSRSTSGNASWTSFTSFQKLYSAETFSSRMMFTCSAFRCSVFDGSAMSASSDHVRPHDGGSAAHGIPDPVLDVTVHDQALVRVQRDFE